jgi:hypothetical protein
VLQTPKSDSDENEEDEYPLVISKIEAKASLDKVRVFIEKTEGANEILFCTWGILKILTTTQTSNSYFKLFLFRIIHTYFVF